MIKMVGRPSKCTKELCDAICKDIKEGNTLKYSVQKQGITEQTFYNWMKKGEDSKTKSGKYFDFFDNIKKAQEEGKNHLVKGIRKHGQNTWQAQAWLLERMYPQEFGKREKVAMEHSGEIKKEVKGSVELNVIDRIKKYREQLDNESD